VNPEPRAGSVNPGAGAAPRPRTNWAGNVAFAAADLYRPATLGQLQAIVARARRIRVLAAGHSFNDLADSPGAQVSLAGLPPEVEIDSAARTGRLLTTAWRTCRRW
jgi:alditol oxidase